MRLTTPLEVDSLRMEERYLAFMRGRADHLHEELMTAIVKRASVQADALSDSAVSEVALFSIVSRFGRLLSTPDAVEALSRSVGRITLGLALQAQRDQVRYLVGLGAAPVAIPNLLPVGYGDTQLRLVKGIDSLILRKFNDRIQKGFARGWTLPRLEEELQAIGRIARGRARLIARNEVGNLASSVTQRTQRAVGVKQYRWSTSLDERVRDSHEDRHGDIFAWDDPPADGHPGEPIQCRCVPIPIMPRR